MAFDRFMDLVQALILLAVSGVLYTLRDVRRKLGEINGTVRELKVAAVIHDRDDNMRFQNLEQDMRDIRHGR